MWCILMRKSIPYANTKIAPEQTKAEIEKLLKDHGIMDIQWTTYQGESTLKFLFRVTIKGVEKEVMFAFRPPMIQMKKKQYSRQNYRYEKIIMDNAPVSYRLLYWYLKSKLEAVQFGLETVEKEFMSHILVALPGGKETTLGENLNKVVEMVKLPQLVNQETILESKIIDVEKS